MKKKLKRFLAPFFLFTSLVLTLETKAAEASFTKTQFLRLINRIDENFEQINSLYKDRLDFIHQLRSYFNNPENTTLTREVRDQVNRVLNICFTESTKELRETHEVTESPEFYEKIKVTALEKLQELENQTIGYSQRKLHNTQFYTKRIKDITLLLNRGDESPLGDEIEIFKRDLSELFTHLSYPLNFDPNQNIYQLFTQIYFNYTLQNRNEYLQGRSTTTMAMLHCVSHDSIALSINLDEFNNLIPLRIREDFHRNSDPTIINRIIKLIEITKQNNSQYFLEEGKSYLQFHDEILYEIIKSGALQPKNLHEQTKSILAKDFWLTSYLTDGPEDEPLPDRSRWSFPLKVIEQSLMETPSEKAFKDHLLRKERAALHCLNNYTPIQEPKLESAAGGKAIDDDSWLDLPTSGTRKKSKKQKGKRKGKRKATKPQKSPVKQLEEPSLFESGVLTPPHKKESPPEGEGEGLLEETPDEEEKTQVERKIDAKEDVPESTQRTSHKKASIEKDEKKKTTYHLLGIGGKGGDFERPTKEPHDRLAIFPEKIATLLKSLEGLTELSWRKFIQQLLGESGFKHVKTRGSHEVWEVEGERFTIVKPHPHSKLGKHQLNWFQKTIQKRFTQKVTL